MGEEHVHSASAVGFEEEDAERVGHAGTKVKVFRYGICSCGHSPMHRHLADTYVRWD